MNKQRNILFSKLSLRTLPNLLFGSVRLLSKNLKTEKKVKNHSLNRTKVPIAQGEKLFRLEVNV